MEKDTCDYCHKKTQYLVVNEQGEQYCESCADVLDSEAMDRSIDMAIAMERGEYDG